MCETERERGRVGGGRETHREERKTEGEERQRETKKKVREREIARERAIAREKERESEGGRESEKKNVRHILCYKMYKTLHGMKHHT